MSHWILQHGQCVIGEELREGHLVIEAGRIKAFVESGNQAELEQYLRDASGSGITYQTVDCTGAVVGPGFIDLHVHGGGGADVMDATVEAYEQMAKTHAEYGTTRFLLTTVTGSHEALMKVCEATREWFGQLGIGQGQGQGSDADLSDDHDRKHLNPNRAGKPLTGALPLGIHLEGPYIAPAKKGAQNADYIRAFSMEEFDAYQTASEHRVKLITLAPERLPDLNTITQLKNDGVVVSIGHTEATYEEVDAAFSHGATHITHLCNAMPPIHHRSPGPITYALNHDGMTVEFIADGLHVHPAIMQLAIRAKKKSEIAIVTDAIRAVGLGDGVTDLGGLTVYVKDRKAVLADGTLAGSCLDMATAYRFLADELTLSIVDRFQWMSTNPARILGVEDQLGTLAPEKIADVVIFRDNECTDVMVAGQWVKGGRTE
ncbi:N-acetylglucosamine-6-phosphate deacetylase [Brevibacillus dissolubilis]|uniref:N-acetylglucosamine-6-phosphate deacetylase n=1 Tax=Brevibacillus dissolubilis TaxID=1844116 RepID=UPI001116423C|nr:N-acetylglucosamine-6-phosphate deacetylase [Brevibacillus dissolubilis]